MTLTLTFALDLIELMCYENLQHISDSQLEPPPFSFLQELNPMTLTLDIWYWNSVFKKNNIYSKVLQLSAKMFYKVWNSDCTFIPDRFLYYASELLPNLKRNEPFWRMLSTPGESNHHPEKRNFNASIFVSNKFMLNLHWKSVCIFISNLWPWFSTKDNSSFPDPDFIWI